MLEGILGIITGLIIIVPIIVIVTKKMGGN
jgi:hypothetical protein